MYNKTNHRKVIFLFIDTQCQ